MIGSLPRIEVRVLGETLVTGSSAFVPIECAHLFGGSGAFCQYCWLTSVTTVIIRCISSVIEYILHFAVSLGRGDDRSLLLVTGQLQVCTSVTMS